MKTIEQELIDYLHEQFPATIGHLPLAEKIHNIWRQGMTDAARLCPSTHVRATTPEMVEFNSGVSQTKDKIQHAILTARDKV